MPWKIFLSLQAGKQANVEYRFKRAKKCVISWLVAQDLHYDEIGKFYIEKLRIDRFDYDKALNKQRVD